MKKRKLDLTWCFAVLPQKVFGTFLAVGGGWCFQPPVAPPCAGLNNVLLEGLAQNNIPGFVSALCLIWKKAMNSGSLAPRHCLRGIGACGSFSARKKKKGEIVFSSRSA